MVMFEELEVGWWHGASDGKSCDLCQEDAHLHQKSSPVHYQHAPVLVHSAVCGQ